MNRCCAFALFPYKSVFGKLLFAHYTLVYGGHNGVTLLKTSILLRDAADAGFRRCS